MFFNKTQLASGWTPLTSSSTQKVASTNSPLKTDTTSVCFLTDVTKNNLRGKKRRQDRTRQDKKRKQEKRKEEKRKEKKRKERKRKEKENIHIHEYITP